MLNLGGDLGGPIGIQIIPKISLPTKIWNFVNNIFHFFQVYHWPTDPNFLPQQNLKFCQQNTPYLFNLMKFWLRHLRLKTMDSIPNIDCSSTFYWLFRNQALSSTLILHQIQRSGSVLEDASHDFKTDPGLWILCSIDWNIQGWRHSSISQESLKSWRGVNCL